MNAQDTSNRPLLLFTSSFPYGESETFLENEIPYLAEAFSKVYIIALNKVDSIRAVPVNVTVLNIGENFENCYTSLKSIEYLKLDTLKIFRHEYKKGGSNVESKSKLISYMLRVNYKALLLESILAKYRISADAVFYSYWFEEWATILSLLKKKRLIDKFHARVHGFDLYEERAINNYIPFRNLQLEQAATISAVSEAGYKYLLGRHPRFQQKYFLHRLGVQDYGVGPFDFDQNITIVSCSNVVPTKRVHLIVEILSHFKQPIKWIHFGGGTLLEAVKERAGRLPDNITTYFKGRVSNQNVISFFKSNKVNLFITTTESEGGCPVSIQEAISFGIPVIGTAVGGVPEIVNSRTGILINRDFDAKEVAKQIEYFLLSDANSPEFREGVRKFWKEGFAAETNFNTYIQKILIDQPL